MSVAHSFSVAATFTDPCRTPLHRPDRVRVSGSLLSSQLFSKPRNPKLTVFRLVRVSFAAFICRALSPTHTVLEADDTVLCEAPEHFVIQFLSGIVLALFAIGVPLVFGYILVSKAQTYNRETKGSNAALVRRVAEYLDVDEVSAEFVIRDVIIGQDYSFLMDACAWLVPSLSANLGHLSLTKRATRLQIRRATCTRRPWTCCVKSLWWVW